MKIAVKTAVLLCVMISSQVMAAWEGVVDWAQRTAMSTATSGVVAKVHARPGQRVAKGGKLLQLEQSALRAEVGGSRATVAQSKLLLEEAKRELARTEELYARTLLADRDLNLARIAHAEAEATHQRNRAAHALALERLRNSELLAPFDAVVLATEVEPGQTVVTEFRAEPQVVIAAADKRLVRFAVSADELDRLPLGQSVSVQVGGERYAGEVISHLLEEGRAGESVAVEAVFSKAASSLLPGQAATVSLP